MQTRGKDAGRKKRLSPSVRHSGYGFLGRKNGALAPSLAPSPQAVHARGAVRMSAVLRPGAWARTCRARVERRGTGRRIRASVVTAAAAQPVEYTVKLGDTLYQIAKKHDVSVKALADANGKTLGRFVPIVVSEKFSMPDQCPPAIRQ